MARIYFVNLYREGEIKGIQIDNSVSSDLAKSVFVGSVIIVLVAWNIPMIIDLFVS
jgi:hypothetical protein